MSRKITLVYDLAVSRGSIAMFDGKSTLGKLVVEVGDISSDRLLPCIEALLNRNRLTARDLNEVVCTRGPGAYTGIRVGLAIAKGLGRAVGAELFGYPVFEVLLSAAEERKSTAAVIDAGRREFLVTGHGVETRHAMVQEKDLAEYLGDHKIKSVVIAADKDSTIKRTAADLQIELIDASDNVTTLLNDLHFERKGRGSSLDPIYGRDLVRQV